MELLVVIAVPGILAALLFPLFPGPNWVDVTYSPAPPGNSAIVENLVGCGQHGTYPLQ